MFGRMCLFNLSSIGALLMKLLTENKLTMSRLFEHIYKHEYSSGDN